MLPKREDHDDDGMDRSREMTALETARSSAESSGEKATDKKDEEHVSLFWRIFGGTILSIVALVTITLYNNMSSSITELRAEVSREREARAELVKKDEFSARSSSIYERMRGIDAVKAEMEGLKEKVHTNATAVDTAKRDSAAAVEAVKKDNRATADTIKKDSAALEVLKERVAALEGIKKDIAGLDTLKEKLTTATADLKIVRDDLTKLSGEVEKNKASDLDRKTTRDTQYKQLEDSLKELQKGLQDCREKLARLEGSKPPSEFLPFRRPAPARPVAPGEEKPSAGPVEPGTAKPGPKPNEPDGE